MDAVKVYTMFFPKVYGCLVAKAQRKGRTAEEVHAVTAWLTGYTAAEIVTAAAPDSPVTYGDFFRHAPRMNPDRELVTGNICGVKIESIEDPLMQDIRRLDKLVDELAKGKPIEKVLRQRVRQKTSTTKQMAKIP